MDSTDNSNTITITYDSEAYSGLTAGSGISSMADTITIDFSNIAAAQTSYTVPSVHTVTINDIGLSNDVFSWSGMETIPFETGFPNWEDFRAMCEEYPGLEKTFEHFKVFYKLCKDEWEAKKRGDAEQ